MKRLQCLRRIKILLFFLLRVHFRQWIEVEGVNIKVYKDFPQQFEVIKEVNKYNHFFYTKDIFGWRGLILPEFSLWQLQLFKWYSVSGVSRAR
jgi:hypothetical protein